MSHHITLHPYIHAFIHSYVPTCMCSYAHMRPYRQTHGQNTDRQRQRQRERERETETETEAEAEADNYMQYTMCNMYMERLNRCLEKPECCQQHPRSTPGLGFALREVSRRTEEARFNEELGSVECRDHAPCLRP